VLKDLGRERSFRRDQTLVRSLKRETPPVSLRLRVDEVHKQMRQEYEFLTCNQVTEEDVLKVTLAIAQAKAKNPPVNVFSYIALWGVLCSMPFVLP
jgi:hypothetical protein